MRPLTILVTPIDCVGHVNACAGATKALLARGHRVIFLLEQSFQGQLAARGFEEDIYQLKTGVAGENAGETWANELFRRGVIGPSSVEEKHEALISTFHWTPHAVEVVRQSDRFIAAAIARHRPDLIWLDAAYIWPSIYFSGIPWVLNMSLTPVIYICADTDEVPPNGSGFPSDAPRDEKWRQFRKLSDRFKYNSLFNDYLEECGHPRFPDDIMVPIEESLLTLYAFPEEYNYPAIRRTNWFNLEVFNKARPEEKGDLGQLLPRSFIEDTLDGRWSGKWVFLSLGSMGSIDLVLMRRLLAIVATTRHKYVVSKGPRHCEYELPANAWGDRFVPQDRLLPHMDLVITHGGNNTVTETFALGKPMLIMPLFGDQYDNAQRLHETGLGLRIDPYHFEAEKLTAGIEQLLYDEKLKVRLEAASRRILNANKHEQLADKIEQLIVKRKNATNVH